MTTHRLVVIGLISPFLLLSCGTNTAPAVLPDTTGAPDTTAIDTSAPPLDVTTGLDGQTDNAEPPPTLADNFGVTETQGQADCEGLSDVRCLLPFPSDALRHNGKLAFGPKSFPEATTGGRLDREAFNQRDGFSTVTPVLFMLPGATLVGLPSVTDIQRSLAPESASVVLDAETGQRIAHWVEIDHFTRGTDAEVLTLRFPKRLPFGHRIIVAISKVQDDSGDLLDAPAGFAALRDQTASHLIGLHARRDHFETAVFPAIESAGVNRQGLQLAWDFTVGTQQDHTQRLLDVRAAALEAMGADGPQYTVMSDQPTPDDEWIARRLEVIVHVPSFVLPADQNGVRRLRLNAAGEPVWEGTEDILVEIQVPRSVETGGVAVPVVQYGHGLFGSRNEAHNAWLRAMADRLGFVIAAADMQGMSEVDIGVWGVVLTADITAWPQVSEQPFQGFIDHMAIAQVFARRWMTQDPDRVAVDPSRIYYYGNSQGGTIGGVLMSLHTDITRGVLGVPGGAYALLLNRSVDFETFSAILKIPFPDPADFALTLALMQTGFDHMDPLSYLQHITDQPLPGSPTHRVLLQVAKEDAQVQNDVSFLVGRSLGASLMVPTPRPVWGFDEVSYPFEGNALVEYDFLMPDNPDPTGPPPEANDTHGLLRKSELGQDQLWHFLETGEVINPCDKACDPD